ncbi:MAG TPA: sigma-54 dependent transcriptional regulator [Candidatus Krumholzibacteriaceae bacterium]|nr:sigma-54 dependent transcriptional regulator [Candidatus Krumholzibacteriaceae bacterium]
MDLVVDIINPGKDSPIASDCAEAGWKVKEFPSVEDFTASKQKTFAPLLILSVPESWQKEQRTEAAAAITDWHDQYSKSQILLLLPGNYRKSDTAAIDFSARHILFKPYDSKDLHQLLVRTARGVGKREKKQTIDKINRKPEGFENIIGVSRPIRDVIDTAKKVASSESTSIMITGENGTGKGAIAKAIHTSSIRKDGPFIEINCAAIPRNLLETEFFGHESGAFTDAKERKIGLFECANGGTVFLDEIGEIDYRLQAKLLKFLDSRTIRRVSGTQFLPVDLRIISATNRNLKKDVLEKRFRADLFYRLNVVEISLPPLRDRIEDIEPIARYYAGQFSTRLKKGDITLTDEAVEILKRYSWPGNIRELINIIERAVLLNTGGQIRAEDLPLKTEKKERTIEISQEKGTIRIDLPPGGTPMREIEKAAIIAALKQTRGNVTAAARLLELERGTIRYKMKKHGIDPSKIKENSVNGQYTPVPVSG